MDTGKLIREYIYMNIVLNIILLIKYNLALIIENSNT